MASAPGGPGREELTAAPSAAKLAAWLDTVGPEVRRRSVELLAKLLHDEQDKVRAAAIAHDLGVLADELLVTRDYTSAAAAAERLMEASLRKPMLGASCRAALDDLADSLAFRQALSRPGKLDEHGRAALLRIAGAVSSAARAKTTVDERVADLLVLEQTYYAVREPIGRPKRYRGRTSPELTTWRVDRGAAGT